MVENDEKLIRNMNGDVTSTSFPLPIFLLLLVFVIVVGVAIGFGVSKMTKPTVMTTTTTSTSTDAAPGKTVGIADKKTFKDQAEGILKEGGVDGEGSFHLERPGGKSQNVYLTSSAVDLEPYINKKVRVWGETHAAEKAGWLMDVGLVEILN